MFYVNPKAIPNLYAEIFQFGQQAEAMYSFTDSMRPFVQGPFSDEIVRFMDKQSLSGSRTTPPLPPPPLPLFTAARSSRHRCRRSEGRHGAAPYPHTHPTSRARPRLLAVAAAAGWTVEWGPHRIGFMSDGNGTWRGEASPWLVFWPVVFSSCCERGCGSGCNFIFYHTCHRPIAGRRGKSQRPKSARRRGVVVRLVSGEWDELRTRVHGGGGAVGRGRASAAAPSR